MSDFRTVWHATPVRNLPSIGLLGIDPSFARGKRQVCWFVGSSLRSWVVLHVAQRHGCEPSEVCLIRVRLARSRLRRRWRSTWVCAEVVRPEEFQAISPAALVA
jgi:hypothetical protein